MRFSSLSSFKNFLFNFLFIDQDKKQVSTTKFWSHIGYAALTFTFVWAVINGTTVDVMIWALFGIVVVGNRTIIKLFGKGGDNESKRE